jgi:stage II sporulation protein P
MKKRWGQAAVAAFSVCCLIVCALAMGSPVGGRLALAVGLPALSGGGHFSGEAFVMLMMPNMIGSKGHSPIFTGTFWESFFETTPTHDAILETLAQDEVFPELSGDGLLPIVRTDLHSSQGVRNSSMMEFDAAALMQEPLDLGEKRDGPQVLIFHTHSREAYNATGEVFAAPDVTHSNDITQSVVAVGAILAQTLEAGGIEVIHCTDIFDTTYTGAYSRSDAAVAAILEQYPSIRVVLDLHRDAVYTSEGGKYRPVVEKDGMDVAQIMMIAGTGNDDDDVNPHWQDNVRFGLTLQSEVEAICPGITRAMMVRTSTYNQNRSKGALLIEVGTTGNTLTEAKRSAYYIGQALCQVLA